MKYRIEETKDSVYVILEDGGFADIRTDVDELTEGYERVAVTEYYQDRFTEEDINTEYGIFGTLGEGKMYIKDWKKSEYSKEKAINDALSWLCMHCSFERDDSIWSSLKF